MANQSSGFSRKANLRGLWMNRLIWAITPALYAIVGMLAAYLTNKNKTLIGAGLGLAAGFLIAMMSVAGEKDK